MYISRPRGMSRLLYIHTQCNATTRAPPFCKTLPPKLFQTKRHASNFFWNLFSWHQDLLQGPPDTGTIVRASGVPFSSCHSRSTFNMWQPWPAPHDWAHFVCHNRRTWAGSHVQPRRAWTDRQAATYTCAKALRKYSKLWWYRDTAIAGMAPIFKNHDIGNLRAGWVLVTFFSTLGEYLRCSVNIWFTHDSLCWLTLCRTWLLKYQPNSINPV